MAITITITVDTPEEEPGVVAPTVASAPAPGDTSGGTSAGPPTTAAGGASSVAGRGRSATDATAGSEVQVPPDLLARAQAVGAHNAGAAPTAVPSDGAPPAFTGDVPRTVLDEESYAQGLADGPTDVSAGAAPGTVDEQDLVVEPAPDEGDDPGAADGGDAADEAAATDAGPPRRRGRKAATAPAKKGAAKATAKAAARR